MGEGGDLEQFAHRIPVTADQTLERPVNLGRPWGVCLQCGGPAFDTQSPQELRLFDRPIPNRTHGFDGARQRLEVYMCSQVDMTRICERIGVGVLTNGLQSFTERGLRV